MRLWIWRSAQSSWKGNGRLGSWRYLLAYMNPYTGMAATASMVKDARDHLVAAGAPIEDATAGSFMVGLTQALIMKGVSSQALGGRISELALRNASIPATVRAFVNEGTRAGFSTALRGIQTGGLATLQNTANMYLMNVGMDMAQQLGTDVWVPGESQRADIAKQFLDSAQNAIYPSIGFGLMPIVSGNARSLGKTPLTAGEFSDLFNQHRRAVEAIQEGQTPVDVGSPDTRQTRFETMLGEINQKWRAAETPEKQRDYLASLNLPNIGVIDSWFRNLQSAEKIDPNIQTLLRLPFEFTPENVQAQLPGAKVTPIDADNMTVEAPLGPNLPNLTVRVTRSATEAPSREQTGSEIEKEAGQPKGWFSSLPEAEQDHYLSQYAPRGTTRFTFSTPDGSATLSHDAILWLAGMPADASLRAGTDAAPTGMAGVDTFHHEYAHAALEMLRKTGAMTPEMEATFAEAFPPRAGSGEAFNEEGWAEGFAQSEKTPQPTTRLGKLFQTIRGFFSRLYQSVTGRTPLDSKVTVDGYFDALRNGKLTAEPNADRAAQYASKFRKPVAGEEVAEHSTPENELHHGDIVEVTRADGGQVEGTVIGPDKYGNAVVLKHDGTGAETLPEKFIQEKDHAIPVTSPESVHVGESSEAGERVRGPHAAGEETSGTRSPEETRLPTKAEDVKPAKPRSFFRLPNVESGFTPVLNAIYDEGGMAGRSKMRNPRGEHDGMPSLGELGGFARIVMGGSTAPDQMAQIVYDKLPGSIRDPSPDALWDAVRKEIRQYRNHRAMEKDQEIETAKERKFTKATSTDRPGTKPVNVDMLHLGDIVTIKGEKMEVIDIDADTGDVRLKDGSVFGLQVLPEGQQIYVEKVTRPRTRPVESKPGEEAPRFQLSQPDDFSLEEQTPEDVAAEWKRQQDRKHAEATQAEIARRQNAPITGTQGSIGQGDLFGADQDELGLTRKFQLSQPKQSGSITDEEGASNEQTETGKENRGQRRAEDGYEGKALHVAEGIQRTGQNHDGHGASDIGPVAIRGREETALEESAKRDGVWLKHDDFTGKWEEQDKVSGRENQVYLDPESNRVFKRTDASKIYLTWGDYLRSLRAFSSAFPETAYRLEGFSRGPGIDGKTRLHAVVSQPAVDIVHRVENGPTHEELSDYLRQRGFDEITDKPGTWKNRETGVTVSDLHSANVVKLINDDGKPVIHVIDAIVRVPKNSSYQSTSSDIRFQLGRRDPEGDLITALGARIVRGNPPDRSEIEEVAQNLHIATPIDDIIDQATRNAAVVSRKLSELHSDADILTALRNKRAIDKYHENLFSMANLQAQAGKQAQRYASLREDAAAKAAKDMLAQVEGISASDVERTFRVDLAGILSEIEPLPLGESSGVGKEEVKEKPSGEVPPDLSGSPGKPHDLASVPANIKALVDSLAQKARATAEDRAEDRKAWRARQEAKGSTAEELTGGEGGEMPAIHTVHIPLELLEKHKVDIRNSGEFTMFLKELVGRYAAEKYRPDSKNPDAVWHDPRAVRELALTAQKIIDEIARNQAASKGREFVRLVTKDFNGIQSLRPLLSQIEYAATRLNDVVIRDARTKGIDEIRGILQDLGNAKGRAKQHLLLKDRRVEPAFEEWARQAIKAIDMSSDAAQHRIDELNASPVWQNIDQRSHLARLEMTALLDFGGLKDRMPGEIADVRDRIQRVLEGSQERILEAWQAREDATQNDAQQLQNMFVPNGPKPKHGAIRNGLDGMLPNLIDNLKAMTNATNPKTVEWGNAVIDKIEYEIARAADQYETEKRTQTQTLHEALASIYGKNYRQALRDLFQPHPEWSMLDRGNQKTEWNKNRVLQMLASVVQSDYVENTAKYGRDGDYIRQLESCLSPQDLKLLNWLRNWADSSRQSISDASLALTGQEVLSPGPNYWRANVKRETQGFSEQHTAWSPFAPGLTKRVRHGLDFDQESGILDTWSRQMLDNAHYKAYASTGLELRGIVGRQDVQTAISETRGREALNQFKQQLTDTLTGHINDETAGSMAWINKLRGWENFACLSYDPGRYLKHGTAFVAFGHEIGIKNVWRHVADVASPEGREAFKTIWNSDQMKNRRMHGIDEAMNNSLNDPNPSSFMRMLRFGMRTSQDSDAFSAALIGSGIYRDLKAGYRDQGMNEQDADAKAKTMTFSVINRVQLSSRMENLNIAQRHGGALGKAFVQFAGPGFHYLGYEVNAMRDALSGKPGSARKLASSLILNHVILPAMFQGSGVLMNIIFGQDTQDEKWREGVRNRMLWSMLAGPFQYAYLIGSTAESFWNGSLGQKDYGHELPLENIIQQGGNAGKFLRDATLAAMSEADAETVLDDIDQFLKASNPLYYDARKAAKNYDQ